MNLGDKTVTFKCEAAGAPTLEYSWKFNGDKIIGKTESTLSLSDINRKQEGCYQCCVKNKYDRVTSNTVELRIGKLNIGIKVANCPKLVYQCSKDFVK